MNLLISPDERKEQQVGEIVIKNISEALLTAKKGRSNDAVTASTSRENMAHTELNAS